MASGRARSTRKLRNWVLEQVESGQFPGVCWDDEDKTMFRIPWKHAGKQDFREEQDAAFFKAWAIFKGKYREGDQADPAAWKTRLRCALNKSSEFEEVPGRGHMEGPEPYKVYRLLPPGILPAPLGTQKLPPKRSHTALSSEDEDNGENKRTCMPSLPSQQNSARSMVAVPSKVPNSSFQHMDDSGIGSNSNSPQPHEVADSIEVISQEDLEMPPSLPDAGLARYHEGLAPPPEIQGTLNFLEEHCDPGSTRNSLITAQMEQAFARHLLEETGFV
uniref:Interferon regulatory factor 9 n=1 Tax=Monodelphis domestica TaxID=13616 RepID=A0A5F8G8N8_MONDO